MNKLLRIFKKYNVEPVIFFYALARHLYYPTLVNQLITDKLCLYEHHQNVTFCENISSPEFKDTEIARKISVDSVNYMTYAQWIRSTPSIVAVVLLGPWLDKFPIAPKIVLLGTVASGLIEACIMMLSVIFFSAAAHWVLVSFILHSLSGGLMMAKTAMFAFAVKETPLAERTFRFGVIEFFLIVTGPLASYISGLLLPLGPWIFEEQTRNYSTIFGVAIVSYSLCLIHVALVLGEVKDLRSPEDSILKRASIRTSLEPMSTEYLSVEAFENEPPAQYVNNGYRSDEADEKDFKPSIQDPLPVLNKKNQSAGQMLKALFNTENAVAMFKGVVKRREEKAHILLWQIIAIYLIVGICINGFFPVQLDFATKNYRIETDLYLRIDSYLSLGLGITSTLVIAAFHKVELKDTIIIISGLVSLFFYLFFQGAILKLIGLILAYVFGSIFKCSIVACRGLVSKIVPENEIGTILGALSVLFVASPMIGSSFYSPIYNATLKFYPGTAFLAGAAFSLIALGVSIWLLVRYNRFEVKKKQKSEFSTG